MPKKAINETTKAAGVATSLVLAIDKMHSDRIFSGEKRFELRKKVPSSRFSTVYLYENGNVGIVGAFRVGKIIKSTINELWQIVGESSTSKDRFFDYFRGCKTGYAIEVRRPIKFSPPLEIAKLRKQLPVFSAPQSYLILRPGSRLSAILKARLEQATSNSTAMLRGIAPSEEDEFIRIVTREIGAKYDGITDGFAKSLLNTHRLGKDPSGILTLNKEVLTICDTAGQLMGFTTLTYKIGGCAKTGPTILLPKFRRKGIGGQTRELIMEHVQKLGVRKLYCTCPDDDEVVIRYLLKAGYSIEGHLSAHYHKEHGELVLGKFVSGPEYRSRKSPTIGAEQCSLVAMEIFSKRVLYRQVHKIMRYMFPEITREQVKRLIDRAGSDGNGTIEEKPLQIHCLKRNAECKGVLMLIPKRGGAVKGLIISETANEKTIRQVVETAESAVRQLNRRKLYFLVPLSQSWLGLFLRQGGYELEGTLREPYAPGEDVLIVSKRFTVLPRGD